MKLKPLQSSLLPAAVPHDGGTLRVATNNNHKGVRGLGPRKRLEIHNLGLAVEAFDA
ncbi:MAG: endonuclease, partial [Pseudomonadota bacterium]